MCVHFILCISIDYLQMKSFLLPKTPPQN